LHCNCRKVSKFFNTQQEGQYLKEYNKKSKLSFAFLIILFKLIFDKMITILPSKGYFLPEFLRQDFKKKIPNS